MPLPAYTAFLEGSEIPNSLVNTLRDKFLEIAANNADDFYKQDVDRIKTTNWPLQRFLISNKKSTDSALNSLVKAMKWRKSFGVLDLSETDFPREMYGSGYMTLYGKDLNGATVMIFRGNVNKKIKSWVPVMEKCFVYFLEKADASNDGKGLTLLVDLNGAGLKNTDIDSLKFIQTVLKEYYPRLVTAIVVYKLPAVLETVYKMVQSWLSEEEKKYLHLTKKKNINDYVAKDQLPDFLLGTNPLSYRITPGNALKAEDLGRKLGLKEGKGEKFAKHFGAFCES